MSESGENHDDPGLVSNWSSTRFRLIIFILTDVTPDYGATRTVFEKWQPSLS